jgi:hypothetical protein
MFVVFRSFHTISELRKLSVLSRTNKTWLQALCGQSRDQM